MSHYTFWLLSFSFTKLSIWKSIFVNLRSRSRGPSHIVTTRHKNSNTVKRTTRWIVFLSVFYIQTLYEDCFLKLLYVKNYEEKKYWRNKISEDGNIYTTLVCSIVVNLNLKKKLIYAHAEIKTYIIFKQLHLFVNFFSWLTKLCFREKEIRNISVRILTREPREVAASDFDETEIC